MAKSKKKTPAPSSGLEKGDLLEAIINEDSGKALEITCRYLLNKETTTLEEEWIAISANHLCLQICLKKLQHSLQHKFSENWFIFSSLKI